MTEKKVSVDTKETSVNTWLQGSPVLGICTLLRAIYVLNTAGESDCLDAQWLECATAGQEVMDSTPPSLLAHLASV